MKESLKKVIFSFAQNFHKQQQMFSVDTSAGICCSLPHRYVDMLIATLESFFLHMNYSLPIFIVNDPNDADALSSDDFVKLKKHFVVQIESKTSQKMKTILKDSTYFAKYRFSRHTSVSKLKFDAVMLSPFRKTILIDSDILFLKTPEEIMKFLEFNTKSILYFSRERDAHKKYPLLLKEELTLRLLLNEVFQKDENFFDPYFTSGLVCLPKNFEFGVHKLDLIFELFFKYNCAHDWLSEERAMGMLCQMYDSKKLSPQKYLTATYWSQYKLAEFSDLTAIHYQGIDGLKSRFMTDALLQQLNIKIT